MSHRRGRVIAALIVSSTVALATCIDEKNPPTRPADRADTDQLQADLAFSAALRARDQPLTVAVRLDLEGLVGPEAAADQVSVVRGLLEFPADLVEFIAPIAPVGEAVAAGSPVEGQVEFLYLARPRSGSVSLSFRFASLGDYRSAEAISLSSAELYLPSGAVRDIRVGPNRGVNETLAALEPREAQPEDWASGLGTPLEPLSGVDVAGPPPPLGGLYLFGDGHVPHDGVINVLDSQECANQSVGNDSTYTDAIEFQTCDSDASPPSGVVAVVDVLYISNFSVGNPLAGSVIGEVIPGQVGTLDSVPPNLPAIRLPYPDPDSVFSLGRVAIAFNPGLSTQRKDSILQAFLGPYTVTGGDPLFGDDGYYYVDFGPLPSIDSVLAVTSAMRSHPDVAIAIPEFLVQGAWAAPQDGPGWRSWNVFPAGVGAANWAPEQISAPLAWGAEVGNQSTVIGVVEEAYSPIPDMAPTTSITTVLLQGPKTPGALANGEAVVGILASPGDDVPGPAN